MKTLLSIIVFCLFSSIATALELSPLSKDPYTGDLDALKKHGVVRVLVSADLGFYYIEHGKPKGIVAELLYHFEKKLKKTHKNLTVQIIPVQRDDLLPSLRSGYGDIAVANLTVTDNRLRTVDFGDPIITNSKEWIITSKDFPTLTSLEDLSGKEIWVRASSSYFESLQNINNILNSQGLSPVIVHFIEESLQDYELIEMINQGYISATVLDSHKSELWLNVMDNIQVHNQLALREDSNIAWALRKESPLLKSEINHFVKVAKTGTLLGNIIYRKYINDTRWLTKVLNPQRVERLSHMTSVFKQYADKFEFDYLMMSAQGYQESGLDQSKVSHKGAVGIMQVLPSTASDKNVNVSDIHILENNVHAGVKYMRFIKDRYFSDENISPDNQIYFTLAAYNAGPAKIRKMRLLAKKRGYDPNKWFRNVEIITRQHVSQEPVTYVTNINRYYVIYKQLATIRAMKNENNALNSPLGRISTEQF